MQLQKVSCVSCPHYSRCSTQTRMYINYCGNRSQDVKKKIARAISECKRNRGRLFQRVSVYTMQAAQAATPLPGTA